MATTPPSPTEAADRIPVSQKIAYGLGGIVANIAVNSIGQLSGLFFVIGLGISAVWMGYVQAIPRFFDAIIDPMIGTWSDNCKSRMGRRKPFLIVGGLLIGIAFALLWTVPRDWPKAAIYAYLVISTLFFYVVVSIYSVPQQALGFELSHDYHEKTKLFAYAAVINNLSSFWLPWVYPLANSSHFSSEVAGIRTLCIGMGVVFSACALTCALVCKEPERVQTLKQKPLSILGSLSATFKNRSFVKLIAAYFLLYVGFQLVMGFSNFIAIYYLYDGHKEEASKLLGWNGTMWGVVGLVGAFPMTSMSKALGKKSTAIFAFVLIVVGNLVKIFCYSPVEPYLNLIPTAMLSLGMCFAFSLVFSMIADVCDEDELRTGVRREGAYSAVYAWFYKVGVSVASIANGYILKWTRYDSALQQQSHRTLFQIRAWEIGLPPALCLVSIAILSTYGLTEKRMGEIKALLKARRGENPAPSAA